MNRFKSTLCAALALTFAAGSAIPVTAAPIMAPKAEAASNGVINVQQNRIERRMDRFERRQDRRERRFERRQERREARFERRNAYYGGHRGYRYKRPGYREYNGYWFPLAAFAAGAIITGAIANDRPAAGGSAHVRWCYDRYRSYREWDNTYQPYTGPRRQCYSPYS